MKNECLWGVDIEFKILMRKVKSPLKQTTPLQICCAPFLNTPEKMAAETRRIFFGFQRRFLEIFFALATPHGFKSNSKENKKLSFYHILWFKRLWWFQRQTRDVTITGGTVRDFCKLWL